MQQSLLLAASILGTLLAVLSAGHALLYKRDPRAALGWIFVCFWIPFAGPLAYWTFGLNRIASRAQRYSQGRFVGGRLSEGRLAKRVRAEGEAVEVELLVAGSAALAAREATPLARIADAVTELPLTAGNCVEALHNGEEAYPAMLAAIDEARQSVYLCTYLFQTGEMGRRFIDALERAQERGVRVRVIIDGVGEKYSWPWAGRLLRRRGIPVARFLPPRLLPPTLHVNLRTHRKILAVDGRVGFTGGMNIGRRHLTRDPEHPNPVVDIHFRLEGPVVRQIEKVFREDWYGLEEEELAPSPAATEPSGDALARIVPDGPDENLDKLHLILLGAVSTARHRLTLVTPYFLPSRELIAVLNTAAIRGVEVRVVLPGESNLPYVHWATRKMLWELLQRGVRVFYQPPPFAHTKVFLVDDHYLLMGSANIDPRSLRLNFELNVEVYDDDLVAELTSHFDDVITRSHEVTLEEIDARPLLIRLRDGVCWLFSPYL